MCGIFGLYSGDPAVPRRVHQDHLFRTLQHRGPDAQGSYQDEGLLLQHTRLSIVDVTSGAQPMSTGDGRYTIVYNGEIYNYLDIRRDLQARGASFRTTSDTEVILRLIQLDGPEDALAALEGMFAFLLWDKSARRLVAARDRIGEKPLYYARVPGGVVLASEIKTLLATGLVSDAVNPQALFEYFCRANVSGSRTMYRDVAELEPGHMVVIEDLAEPPTPRPYWDLVEHTWNSAFEAPVREKDAARRIEALLRASVSSRMMSDVPVGLLLSGGLDSSVVAALLAEQGSRQLTCLTAGNADPEIDESPFAELLVRALNARGARLHLQRLQASVPDILAEVQYLTWVHDEPLTYLNSVQMYLLCKSARDQGIKVLVSGEGSDEIFAGYDRHERLANELPERLARGERLEDILWYQGGASNAELVAALNKVGGKPAAEHMGEGHGWLRQHRDLEPMDLALLFDQRHRLQTLIQRQDRMGMAASIESRQPYLHYGLMTLANTLPLSMKLGASPGDRKRVLRRIARGLVPQEILRRPKAGFPTDLQLWFRSSAARDAIRGMVRSSRSLTQAYLDGAVVREVLEDHFGERKNFDFLVHRIYFLELWNLHRPRAPRGLAA